MIIIYYKLYNHINKKSCKDNILNLIENKFGKNVNIIISIWCIKN